MSPLSIILLLPVKKCVWSESGEKSAQIKHCLQAKTALNEYVGGFWCDRQQEMNFFIMDSYFGQTWWFENALMLDLFLANTQLFSSKYINWWTGVVWITCGLLWCFHQLFGLSFWRHPFTAEHPLLSKWWNDKLHQNCSDEETNSFWIAWGWVHFQQIFIFGWTIPTSISITTSAHSKQLWTPWPLKIKFRPAKFRLHFFHDK